MSNFEIIKQDERFALFQDGELIATYSRKDSAVRRMRKIEQSLNQSIQNELFEESSIQSTSKEFNFRIYEDDSVQSIEQEPTHQKFLILTVEAEDFKSAQWCAKAFANKGYDKLAALNAASQFAGESLFEMNKIKEILSSAFEISKGEERTHALTQRDERGAARVGARSPP